ncbi:MAG: DNA mismatch repair endonuclease MutL [Syntrophomonadaceae bacterium]|nr:DNA mismatch repair endonuclease MutL [Syntrophomonadaceae bacterium]
MTIRLLDDHLVNQIAAGEVVERPASVVKELVENAIDAGATRIEVSIAGGGIARILVRDNGHGIEESELPLALRRHATSKICRQEDLQCIRTLGFRGEALPSIAAVARLDICSARPGHAGSGMRVEGGAVVEVGPRACPPGTQVVVSDLFYNTPARRKFLKSTATEANHVYAQVSRLALSHPEISVSLANERRTVFKTPGNGVLADTVASLFGADFLAAMVPVEYRGGEVELRGMASRPDFVRSHRRDQFFFVNGRAVRSPLLFAAVDEAYRGLLLRREFPAVILFLTLPPTQVDVNVHPQKAEVRFADERGIFNLVRQVLRRSLEVGVQAGGQPAAARPEPPWEGAGVLPRQSEALPGWVLNEDRRDFAPPGGLFRSEQAEPPAEASPGHGHGPVPFRLLGQWLDSYLVLELGEALWIVDQHAAHERVLYERLRVSRRAFTSQGLAFPVTLDVPASRMQLAEDNLEFFRDIGFDLQPLGYNSLLMRAAPQVVAGHEVEAVEEILELLAEERAEDLLLGDQITVLMACKGAIKAGSPLREEEMQQLVRDWLATEHHHHCPHGRPVIVLLTAEEMERRLKRA